jgi:hypothetical protein
MLVLRLDQNSSVSGVILSISRFMGIYEMVIGLQIRGTHVEMK